MKPIITLSIFLILTAGCAGSGPNAENRDGRDVTAPQDDAEKKATVYLPDNGDVMLKNGKILVYENGNWRIAEKNVTLRDGTVITLKGDVKNEDGRMITLEEGETIKKTGQFFDKAGKAIKNAWGSVKKGLEEAGNEVEAGAEKAGKALKEGEKELSEKTKKIVDSIKH